MYFRGIRNFRGTLGAPLIVKSQNWFKKWNQHSRKHIFSYLPHVSRPYSQVYKIFDPRGGLYIVKCTWTERWRLLHIPLRQAIRCVFPWCSAIKSGRDTAFPKKMRFFEFLPFSPKVWGFGKIPSQGLWRIARRIISQIFRFVTSN